jgi:hypothetical protein
VHYGHSISSVVTIIYPTILEYIESHAFEIEPKSNLLELARDVFVNGGAERFRSSILSTVIKIVQFNRALEEKLLNIVCIVAISMKSLFSLYVTQLNHYFNFSLVPELIILIKELNEGKSIEHHLLTLSSYSTISIHESSFENILFNSTYISPEDAYGLNPPSNEFDDAQWTYWTHIFFNDVTEFCFKNYFCL